MDQVAEFDRPTTWQVLSIMEALGTVEHLARDGDTIEAVSPELAVYVEAQAVRCGVDVTVVVCDGCRE